MYLGGNKGNKVTDWGNLGCRIDNISVVNDVLPRNTKRKII